MENNMYKKSYNFEKYRKYLDDFKNMSDNIYDQTCNEIYMNAELFSSDLYMQISDLMKYDDLDTLKTIDNNFIVKNCELLFKKALYKGCSKIVSFLFNLCAIDIDSLNIIFLSVRKGCPLKIFEYIYNQSAYLFDNTSVDKLFIIASYNLEKSKLSDQIIFLLPQCIDLIYNDTTFFKSYYLKGNLQLCNEMVKYGINYSCINEIDLSLYLKHYQYYDDKIFVILFVNCLEYGYINKNCNKLKLRIILTENYNIINAALNNGIDLFQIDYKISDCNKELIGLLTSSVNLETLTAILLDRHD